MFAIVVCAFFALFTAAITVIFYKKPSNKPFQKHVHKQKHVENVIPVDYRRYDYTKSEKARYILISAAVLFFVGYLFFKNIFFSCILCAFSPLYLKINKRNLIKKRKHKLSMQFKDALYSISSSLSAGKSAESAFIDAVKDLRIQYPDENTYIIKELELINRKMSMNQTLASALQEFALRADIEDINNFVDVFCICKNTGGNLAEVVKSTYSIINQKIEVKNEIQVIIAEQKLSQRILNIVPFGLLTLLSATSPDYIEPLYSIKGHLVMLIVLILLAISLAISSKITDIEV